MPANDTVTTEPPAVPTVSPRFILVMAGQLASQAEGLLFDALTTLDLTDDPEGIDETIAQALTDLNAAVKQVRAFKQARAAGVEFDRPAVFQIGGGMIRELADLFTLYGATTPEGFARRVAATSDFDLRVVGVEVAAVGEVGARPGVRIEVRPPVADLVISRSLAYPFTRSKWADSLAAAEAEAGQAIEDAANPAAQEPGAATDEGQVVVA